MPTPEARTPVRVLAAQSGDIPEKGRLVVDIGDTTIGIFRVAGKLYAYENTCPHMGGPVCQGTIIPAVREVLSETKASTGYMFDESDMRIVCPWHGYEFSIHTGTHPGKADVRLESFPVEEKGGEIYVTV